MTSLAGGRANRNPAGLNCPNLVLTVQRTLSRDCGQSNSAVAVDSGGVADGHTRVLILASAPYSVRGVGGGGGDAANVSAGMLLAFCIQYMVGGVGLSKFLYTASCSMYGRT